MAKSYKLQHFARPEFLKRIDRTLLVSFLRPYSEYFAGREVEVVDSDELDYDAIAHALVTVDDGAPEDLLDALFFVDEMSVPEVYDDLLDEALAANVPLGDSDDMNDADLVLRVWMNDRQIIERMHAERHVIRPKRFESFLSAANSLPAVGMPTDAVLAAIEHDLDEWFETRKKGRGTRVFPFQREDGLWFLVRHGERFKREGTMGQQTSIFYRPEKFDVLIYNPDIGELAIHADPKCDKQKYCELVGEHIFSDVAFFDLSGVDGRFTLDPIRQDGPGCLVCGDVDGIEHVRLSELQFRHNSAQYHIEIHKADDVFAALDEINRRIPRRARLLKATFKVKFTNGVRERSVAIRPPNVTIFDRETDAAVVQIWLQARGFIKMRGAQNEVPDSAVAIS